MGGKKKFSRIDYLSLNLKEIKDNLRADKSTQFTVSENDEEKRLENTSWLLSVPSQIAVSRNKIGESLLKFQRNDFLLDDPRMIRSRFFVEYHRLQDPALKHYFDSVPVRKRLEELSMVTESNDAICSTKEMADYLRYLESLRSLRLLDSIKQKKEQKLLDHMQKVQKERKRKSKSGIFPHRKHKSESAAKRHADDKARVSSKKIDLAIERAAKIREQKSIDAKLKNQLKEEKCKLKKKVIAQNNAKRQKEAKFELERKLELAKMRKKSLQAEKKLAKNNQTIDGFKKHWRFREQMLLKNKKLFEEHEKIKQGNIEEHKKQMEKFYEFNTNRRVIIRREMAIQKSNEKMVEIIAKEMKIMSKKYLKLADPLHLEEVSRRFALLSQPFIVENLKNVEQIVKNLKITVSYATMVCNTFSHMKQIVTLLPEIGPSKCVLVRKRIAEFIANAITRTKNDSLKRIKNDSSRSSKTESTGRSSAQRSTHFREREVSVIEIVQAVEETVNYSEEGRRQKVPVSESNREYDYKKMIHIMLKNFFESIIKCEFNYSDKFKTRDFIHLYEFQKYFLHRSMKRFMALVRQKQYHYWKEKIDVTPWLDYNLKLDELSLEAASIIMSYPEDPTQLSECIRKISRFICIQISLQLDQVEDVKICDDATSTDSDWDNHCGCWY